VAITSHLAELEITSTDVVAAWNALEPAVAQCAGLIGTPATKSDYFVGHSDDKGTVRAGLTFVIASIEWRPPHRSPLRIQRGAARAPIPTASS
jgi:hypothetical protein